MKSRIHGLAKSGTVGKSKLSDYLRLSGKTYENQAYIPTAIAYLSLGDK